MFVGRGRRGGSCLCRECSAARVWRAASCAAVWPRALRLAFGRARLFQNAGVARAARVALITKLVRRAAARGRARVEHGAAAAGLHSSQRALRCTSAPRSVSCGASGVSQPLARGGARARSCDFFLCQAVQRSTPVGSLRVQLGSISRAAPQSDGLVFEIGGPPAAGGIRANLRETYVRSLPGTARGVFAAGCCSRRGFGRPAANARLEAECSSRPAPAVFRSPR